MGSRLPNTPRDPDEEARLMREAQRAQREDRTYHDDFTQSLDKGVGMEPVGNAAGAMLGMAAEGVHRLYKYFNPDSQEELDAQELRGLEAEQSTMDGRDKSREYKKVFQRPALGHERNAEIGAQNAQVSREQKTGRGWHPPLMRNLENALGGGEEDINSKLHRERRLQQLRPEVAPRMKDFMNQRMQMRAQQPPVHQGTEPPPGIAQKPAAPMPYFNPENEKLWMPGYRREDQESPQNRVPEIPRPEAPRPQVRPPQRMQGPPEPKPVPGSSYSFDTSQSPVEQNMDFQKGDSIGARAPAQPEFSMSEDQAPYPMGHGGPGAQEFEIGDPLMNAGVDHDQTRELPPDPEDAPWAPEPMLAQAGEAEPKNKMRDYLEQKMMGRREPSMLPLMDVFNRAGAQAGTLAGKAADTKSFSDFTKSHLDMEKDDEDRRIKIMQYLQDKKGKGSDPEKWAHERNKLSQKAYNDKERNKNQLEGIKERKLMLEDAIGSREKIATAGFEMQNLERLRKEAAEDLKNDPNSIEGKQKLADIDYKIAQTKLTNVRANKAEKAPAGKRITSTAIKSKRFGDMAKSASDNFDKLVAGEKGRPGHDPTDKSDYYFGDLPLVGNYINSPGGQLQKQYELEFIRAVLRDESGALIGKDEFSEDRKKYFPRPGDTPAVIAAKKVARDNSINGLYLDYESQGGAETESRPTKQITQDGDEYTVEYDPDDPDNQQLWKEVK